MYNVINNNSNKRMRIGVFVCDLENMYIQFLISGIEIAAEEMDADVVIMPGRSLLHDGGEAAPNNHFSYQHNVIYNYAAINDFDVILIDTMTVAAGLDEHELREFLKKYGDTPIITMGDKIPSFPHVSFDNRNGLRDGVNRLIKNYGRKSIGFVSGPMINADARERLLVYRETLMENSMPFDGRKVVYGTFRDDCDELVEQLLDTNPDMDAIVFANDRMALSGYRVLKQRRVEIGSEILVMGFDDNPIALSMEPTLTTVRADAVKLGYESVKRSREFIEGRVDNVIIDTNLIVRESFGSGTIEFAGMNTQLEGIPQENLVATVLPGIYDTLFEGYYDKEVIEKHKRLIRDCVEYIFGLIYAKPCNVIMYDVIGQKLSMWLRQEDDIPVYRRVRVMEYLYYIVNKSLLDDISKCNFAEMFKIVYKDIYILKDQLNHVERSVAERINYNMAVLMRDMLNYANNDLNIYESMVDKIDDLYLKECYLYVYPEIHTCVETQAFKIPSYLKLRLYKNGVQKGCPDDKKQRIGPDQLFDNFLVRKEKRHTYIATVLFSKEEQYGVFVASMDRHNYKYLRTIIRQFSSAVKMIFLLKQNARLTAKLEYNLKQIKENNHVLSEISKRDELTGIYNRRGFISAVEEELNDPANRDKKAIVVYADMNNLKIINDRFGHEEGDFSLKLVASMLKESFRSTDIIGRFGGDEFAAFALVDQENYISKLRERINNITERANANTDKPYFVSMSVGICEFLCEDGVSITDIMDTADGDLYSQKKNKRTEVMK